MDKRDPFGLYRALGLTSAATTEELENAVKYPFFVRSGDDTDKPFEEALRLAPQAFDILTDPARKGNYDWFARNLPEADGETDWASQFDLRSIVDGPTHCCSCGRVTPLPRYVAISEVRGSLHTYARTTQEEGLLCADCAKAFARKSALTTLFFGFLSKGGPYKAAWSWLKNGQRGHHLKTTDERLALHNARAYLERGEVKLAYALAKISAKSKDEDIAGQSAAIMREIEAAGGDYWNYRLPDPWAVPAGERVVYAVLPFAILTAFIAFYYGYAAQQNELAFGPVVVKGASIPVCRELPRNGDILTRQSPGGGDITLRIWNKTYQNAILKIRDGQSGAVMASVFVASQNSYDFEAFTGRSYRLQYALGNRLDASCKKIIAPNREAEFRKTDAESFYIESGSRNFDAYQMDYGNDRIGDGITSAEFDKP